MSLSVVIGIGNGFRRDDGVGLAVAEDIAQRNLSGVRVVTDIGDPATIPESWAGARLAVVVDAAMGAGSDPGRIRRWTPGDEADAGVVSSHAMGLPQAYALGEALGQIPDRLVILSIDIADADYGVGLTPRVAATVPGVVEAVLAELAGDLRRSVRD
jgi:hydrogenase maturation protease